MPAKRRADRAGGPFGAHRNDAHQGASGRRPGYPSRASWSFAGELYRVSHQRASSPQDRHRPAAPATAAPWSAGAPVLRHARGDRAVVRRRPGPSPRSRRGRASDLRYASSRVLLQPQVRRADPAWRPPMEPGGWGWCVAAPRRDWLRGCEVDAKEPRVRMSPHRRPLAWPTMASWLDRRTLARCGRGCAAGQGGAFLMLTKLSFQNFKSWRDTGDIRLAPITGLFGTNSSGKTSIVQMLLLLKQTAESPDRAQVLNLGDDKSLADLGTFQRSEE